MGSKFFASKKAAGFLFLISLFQLVSLSVRAIDFPLRDNPNTELLLINNSDVDYGLRTHLISRAKHSVEMINFSHGADKIGLSLTKSLRTAMNNGVKVRYAFESLISRIDADPEAKTGKLLTDSNLKRPGEIITARFFDKLKSSFSLSDFIHEKLIIIDAGTPDEVIFIGGRGASDFSEKILDSAFLIRPIDPKLPYIGQDFSKFFENFWGIVSDAYPLLTPKPLAPKLKAEIDDSPSDFPMPPEERADVNSFLDLLSRAPSKDDHLEPFQFHPKSLKLVANGFFERFGSEIVRSTLFARPEIADNPLVREISAIVRRSKRVQLSSYVLGPPEPFKAALVDGLRHGLELDIFTNGSEAHKMLSDTGVIVDYTTSSYLSLAEEAGVPREQMNMYHFMPQATEVALADARHPIYFHRKQIIADDTVVVGSDNYTLSSATKNDEFILVIDDPRMAKSLRATNTFEAATVFKKVTQRKMKRDFKNTEWISDLCLPLIKMLY